MHRFLAVLALTLLPISSSAQVMPGSPFQGGSVGGTSLTRFVECPAKAMSTTSGGAAQPVATITTTTLTGGAATMFYNLVAASGTTINSDSASVGITWANPAGTVSATGSAAANQSDTDPTGTLVPAPSVTVATNVVTINLTPTWTVVVPTSVTARITFIVHGVNTVVCQ